MSTWEITQKAAYLTDFIQLSENVQKAVVKAVEELEQDPVTPRGNTIKKLQGYENVWRYRLGDFRLIYAADRDNRMLRLLAVGPRSSVYERFNYRGWDAPDAAVEFGPRMEQVPEWGKPPDWFRPHQRELQKERLPRRLTSSLLRKWGIDEQYHAILVRCKYAEDLLNLDRVPSDVIGRVMDVLFPPRANEIAAQPDRVLLDPEDLLSFEEVNLWPTTPIQILTEGRTDWKHLKAAYDKLKSEGRFPGLNLQFQEEESDLGDSELLRMCKAYSRAPHPFPFLFIFDRDVARTVREVTETNKDYKVWGNNVFSMALPVPDHRKDTPDVSIEFYYHDDEIMQFDGNGRRLFIGTEFNERTLLHESGQFVCADRNKTGRFTIIDSQVYAVESQSEENLALSKNDFAKYILNGAPNFDDFELSAFVNLFRLISQIMR